MIPLTTPVGPELLVIALIFVILGAIVVGIVYVVRMIGGNVSKKQQRTEELGQRVAELETKYESK